MVPVLLGEGSFDDFVEEMIGQEVTEWGGACCFPAVQAADDLTMMVTGATQADCAQKMQAELIAVNRSVAVNGHTLRGPSRVP
jgi:hypothetical protein